MADTDFTPIYTELMRELAPAPDAAEPAGESTGATEAPVPVPV